MITGQASQNYCVTGMYTGPYKSAFSYEEDESVKRTRINNAEVIAYFEKLGHKVMEDRSRHTWTYWHEIYVKGDGLVCQIDGGVPLKFIREDFTAWANGLEATSTGEDYAVSGTLDSDGKITESFLRLCKQVAETAP